MREEHIAWPDTPDGWRFVVNGREVPVEVETVEQSVGEHRVLDRVLARVRLGEVEHAHVDSAVRWAVPALAGKLLAENHTLTAVLAPGVENPTVSVWWLGELLARIHGDGGHRQTAIGTEAASVEADALVVRLLTAVGREPTDGAGHKAPTKPRPLGVYVSDRRGPADDDGAGAAVGTRFAEGPRVRPGGEMNKPETRYAEPVLCFIDDGRAWFTTRELRHQWGDDWDDAPYEHNAGEPYSWHPAYAKNGIAPYKVVAVSFSAPGADDPSSLGGGNSPFSVELINRGVVAWLWGEGFVLHAGVTLTKFTRTLRAAGRHVGAPEEA